MNLTLYSILGGLALSIAAFFYGQHEGIAQGNLKLAQEQNNEYESYLAFDQYTQTASKIAAAKAKADQYKYQSDLASANARAAAAADTSSKLRDAFSLYASGGWFKSSLADSGKDASCVSISAANEAIGRLAHDASVLDADGLRASEGAAECAVRLTACERWADTVESEFGVKPSPSSGSTP